MSLQQLGQGRRVPVRGAVVAVLQVPLGGATAVLAFCHSGEVHRIAGQHAVAQLPSPILSACAMDEGKIAVGCNNGLFILELDTNSYYQATSYKLPVPCVRWRAPHLYASFLDAPGGRPRYLRGARSPDAALAFCVVQLDGALRVVRELAGLASNGVFDVDERGLLQAPSLPDVGVGAILNY